MTDTLETLTVADVERQKLQKHFGRFDILFFLVCTIVGVDTIATVAQGGGEAFTWMMIFAVAFFVPQALLFAELGTAFPQEGGPYYWTRLAFGHLAGAVNNFLYWITNPVWIGGTLAISCIGAVEVFFNHGNTVPTAVFYVITLAFVWVSIVAAITSFSVGKWVPTAGAFARFLLLAMFIITVIVFAAKHGVHGLGAASYSPTAGGFVLLVGVLLFNFVGFELPNAAGDEMKDPQRDVPFTVMRATIASVLLYGIPILAILMVLPADQITGLGGFIDAMKSVFTVYGGHTTSDGAVLTGAGKVLGDLMAAGFILVLLSSGTTWLMGSDRTQAVAGYDGAGPRILGYFSSRFGTPIVVNFLSGAVSTIVMVLAFQLSGGNDEKYFNAVLNVVLLFTTISYIWIFPTLIKLRYTHPDVPRPYKVPFGMAGVWICGVLTTFWALFASVVGLFPGLGDGGLLNDSALPEGFSRGTFELVVFIPLIVTLLVGILFYALGAKTRSQVAPEHTEQEATDKAPGVVIA